MYHEYENHGINESGIEDREMAYPEERCNCGSFLRIVMKDNKPFGKQAVECLHHGELAVRRLLSFEDTEDVRRILVEAVTEADREILVNEIARLCTVKHLEELMGRVPEERPLRKKEYVS